MKFAVAFALAGLAAAAPFQDDSKYEIPSGNPKGLLPGSPIHQRAAQDEILPGDPKGLLPGSPINGRAAQDEILPGDPKGLLPGSPINGALSKRVIGPGAAAVLGGVVSGIVAPAITRFANKIFGSSKKRSEAGTDVEGDLVIGSDVTWDELRAAFLDGVTNEIFQDATDNETAVCVGVPYNVSDATKVDDAASVNFTVNGKDVVFDCFVLAPGVTFSVAPENATESNLEIIAHQAIELDATGKLTTV